MKIVLNGIERDLDAATSLTQLLESTGYGERRIAVEINREIVPRSRYDACLIENGDHIEIVHAIGGG
ncbi:MAG: sulfur carrier protein ThiS [Dokdonella sp.]